MKKYSVTHKSDIAFNNHLAKLKKRGALLLKVTKYPHTITYTFPENGNVLKEAITDAIKLKRFPFDYKDGKMLYSLSEQKQIEGEKYFTEFYVPVDKNLPSGKKHWINKPIGVNGKIFLYLLEQNFIVQDEWKNNTDYYKLNDSGNDFVNVVNNRVETLTGIKQGTDLFPTYK